MVNRPPKAPSAPAANPIEIILDKRSGIRRGKITPVKMRQEEAITIGFLPNMSARYKRRNVTIVMIRRALVLPRARRYDFSQ